MYKDQDPLNKIYTTLITEGTFMDHTSNERDEHGHANKPVFEPGKHVFECDEVKLNTGDVLPLEVYFDAHYQNEDFENIEGRQVRTHDAGYYVNLHRLIVANLPQEELDMGTIKPGTFKPGTDVTKLVPQNEIRHIEDHLTSMFNHEHERNEGKEF